MMTENLTPLQLELNSLKPGEIREHKAKIEGFRDEVRFYRIGTLGEALLTMHPFWTNEPKPEAIPSRTPRPFVPHLPELPANSLSLLDPPVISFSGRPKLFGHLYRHSWATLMAEPLLDCILELDGDAIEFVPATIIHATRETIRRDLPKCFFVMPLRAIDCIDVERTSVKLSFLEPLPEITKPMRKCEFFEGYTVRTDIPADVHIFSNVFNGVLMFSTQLLELAQKRGVWGVWARRTEKGTAEMSLSF